MDLNKPRLTLTWARKTEKCFAKLSISSCFPKQAQSEIHSETGITVFNPVNCAARDSLYWGRISRDLLCAEG